MSSVRITDDVLDGMKNYYDNRAAEYDEWFYRKGRYDYGTEVNDRWNADAAEVTAALEGFGMGGDVLELAAGTGIWTKRLAAVARSVTAIDASPQMIEINRNKVAAPNVNYVLSDLFEWNPQTPYDGVFLGFWISHVPTERLDGFLSNVAAALKPGGKIFFVDSRPDQSMSARNHVLPEPGSQTMKRLLNDGSSFDIVKNFFKPDELEKRCAQASLRVKVRETPSYFFYGAGERL